MAIVAPAHAMPACVSAASDNDGDGFGWENNNTCIVTFAAGSNSSTPICSAQVTDTDRDGWGYENNRSCVINTQPSPTVQQTNQNGRPICSSAVSDSNNDGWGYENGQSCVVSASSGNNASSDGTASSVSTPGVAPPPVAAAVPGFSGGHPICLTDASDVRNNGFGYENRRTCKVVQGTTATRSQPLLNQRSCVPWLEIGYGNYRLQNNTWNSSAVYFNNWSQCIELTGNSSNYVAKWDYNWLPRNNGDEFAVKSYPQVYYGRKTQYNVSGTVAETGLPARTNTMPQFWVEYDYSCLLYTSPSPRDKRQSRMPSSA